MNKDTVKGKWTEIKGDVQKAWGKLTGDELEQTKGDYKSIRGLIQQKYGKSMDEHDQKLNSIFDKFGQRRDEVVATIKEKLKN